MADQLAIWNVALAHLGQRRLATLADPNESARVLADEWMAAVNACLEVWPWSFATCLIALQTQGPAGYGLDNSFDKPSDWLRTADVAADSAFSVPVLHYVEEGDLYYADPATLYLRYVSNKTDFGLNIGRWPQAFADWVALSLAVRMCSRLTGNDERLAGLLKLRDTARGEAMAHEGRITARTPQPADPGLQIQLRTYNAALAYLGRPRIASLTQADETTRELNEHWSEAVRWALERGPWTWSIRAAMIGPSPSVTPTFGHQNAFQKPEDWLQTVLVSEFDDFRAGATRYADETGWWFSDSPGLFIRYVSGGPNYGTNLPRWPASFCDLVASRLAEQSAGALGAAASIPGLLTLRERTMKTLRASDALNTPPVFPPVGRWVSARLGASRAGRRWGEGPGGPAIPATGDTSLTGDSDLPVNTDIIPRISG